MHCCAYSGGQLCFVGAVNDQQVILPIFAPPVKKLKKHRVAKLQSNPIVKVGVAAAPAPLQCGGDMVKPLLTPEEEDEKSDHYRMRCNASNERRKTKFLASRRHQVHCY